MTTTMAATLGGVPLILEMGAGAEVRQPLGYAIVGGPIVSLTPTLFATPVVDIDLDHSSVLRKPAPKRTPQLDAAVQAAPLAEGRSSSARSPPIASLASTQRPVGVFASGDAFR